MTKEQEPVLKLIRLPGFIKKLNEALPDGDGAILLGDYTETRPTLGEVIFNWRQRRKMAGMWQYHMTFRTQAPGVRPHSIGIIKVEYGDVDTGNGESPGKYERVVFRTDGPIALKGDDVIIPECLVDVTIVNDLNKMVPYRSDYQRGRLTYHGTNLSGVLPLTWFLGR